VRLDEARSRDTVGFGLGLAIAQRLVAADGGTLRLANRPEAGLAATVIIPRSNTSLQSGASTAKLGG